MRAVVTQHVAPNSPSPPFTRCPGNQKLTRTNYCSQIHNFLTFTKCLKALNNASIFLNQNIYYPLIIAFWREWSDLSIGSVTVCPPLNSALASPRSHFCVCFALIHTFCSRQWNAAPVSALNAVCCWLSQPCVGCHGVQMCLRHLRLQLLCHFTGIYSRDMRMMYESLRY